MIITRTPFRVSFVGGGSDFPDFYQYHQGAVLSTTIDKYLYISSHQFFEPHRIRVKYSETETVVNRDLLKHPIFRVVLQKLNFHGGIEVSSIADIPAGTGMGSSSSFTVGLLHNLLHVRNEPVTKTQLAEDACAVEIDMLQCPIGKQDQYAAAFGGLNVIEFSHNGVNVVPVQISDTTLMLVQDNLIMFYTGMNRDATSILHEQRQNIRSLERRAMLKEMVSLVYALRDAMESGFVSAIGELLHHNWLLKKKLAGDISNPLINSYYDKALQYGARGGKLLGAGGAGFLLFYCPKEEQPQLIKAMQPLRHFPFRFEYNGSQLIYEQSTAL